MSALHVRALTPLDSSDFAELAPAWLHPLLTRLPQKRGAFAVGASADGRPVGLLLGRRHRLGQIGQIVHLSLHPEAIEILSTLLACAERALQSRGFESASLTLYQLQPSRLAQGIQAAGWHVDASMTTWVRNDLSEALPPAARAAKRTLGAHTEIRRWGALPESARAALMQEHSERRGLGQRVWEPGLGPSKRADPRLSHAILSRGRVLGWIMVTRRRRGLLYDRLFVRPSAQGRGLGGVLIARALMAHHLAQPTTPAFAHVPDSRISAARMYERHFAAYADERARALVFLKTLTG